MLWTKFILSKENNLTGCCFGNHQREEWLVTSLFFLVSRQSACSWVLPWLLSLSLFLLYIQVFLCCQFLYMHQGKCQASWQPESSVYLCVSDYFYIFSTLESIYIIEWFHRDFTWPSSSRILIPHQFFAQILHLFFYQWFHLSIQVITCSTSFLAIEVF